MYYEARIHEIIEVANAFDAAEKIKSEQIRTNQVMMWTSRDGQFLMYAVPDGHIDNMLLELAILRKTIQKDDAPYQQVESITNGWINDAETLCKYMEEAELSDIIMKSYTQLIIGQPKGNEVAWFSCGCCGTSFKDNVLAQLAFNQDAGYGICPKCQQW